MAERIERVLAVDVGSTHLKHAVCTRTGDVLRFGRLPSAPSPAGLLRQVRHLIHLHQPEAYEALTLTGRMGQAVIGWDDGSVRLNGWPDMGVGTLERFRQWGVENTGYPADSPRFRGWWLENFPHQLGVREITPIKDWLIAQLTGVRRTDPSNAGALGLLDLRSGSWDERLLRNMSVPADVLPDIEGPREGTPLLLKRRGHASPVCVYRNAGDGVTGPLGVGVPFAGQAYVNLGTHAVLRVFYEQWHGKPGDFTYPTGIGGYFSGVIRMGTGRLLEQGTGNLRPGERDVERARRAAEMVKEMADAIGGAAKFESLHLLGGGTQWPGIAEAVREQLEVGVTVADSAATLKGAASLVFSASACRCR